ncbi:MAG TPA: hypothetical protein VEM15_01520 [Thermodesulfobacteriota bacterium]|nr:hypothetical protein [Thermodesulfobacteriota bacterium]
MEEDEEFTKGSKGTEKSPLELLIDIEDFLEEPHHFPLQKTKLEHDQALLVTSLIVVVFLSIKPAGRSQG